MQARSTCKQGPRDLEGQEWLESDGCGGFASGTSLLIRTRRYHALLLAATKPPAGRMVLVSGLEAWLTTEKGRYALSAQQYAGGVIHPDGQRFVQSFSHTPWPTWVFEVADGTRITHEFAAVRHSGESLLRWQIEKARDGCFEPRGYLLEVRLLISGRDFHALHRENPHFDFSVREGQGTRFVKPYPGVPEIVIRTNGTYRHEPVWYRNFSYQREQERGLDNLEDLASPGVLTFDLGSDAAWIGLSTVRSQDSSQSASPLGLERGTPNLSEKNGSELLEVEAARRRALGGARDVAAESYIARRGAGLTLIAGYPWFDDWGRDTFIALRGLCLARGQLESGGAILEEWSSLLSAGMLPNRFPGAHDAPEYNSVDASLWYIVAAHEYLEALSIQSARAAVSLAERRRLEERRGKLITTTLTILDAYTLGTRFRIKQDSDGLLACGQPGLQLTWMDAKIGDSVITPRVGKPVEVQALWLNALHIGASFEPRFRATFAAGRAAFRERFYRADVGALYDNIDVDHVYGQVDASIRPNQIFAVGGLPLCLLAQDQAERVLVATERALLTPLGLRSLSPDDPNYRGRYEGGVELRDGAYHQGTVWPWLLGPFVEGWLRVHGATEATRRQARERFLKPLWRHLEEGGLGHISELADGDAPHTPRGAPFQAWSLGELFRIERVLEDK